MKKMNVTEKFKYILDPKKAGISARMFVTRDDGITIYDSIQNQTTTSVAALVSGVWQASEALMGLVYPKQDILEYRLGFDTSSQGIYLFPLIISNKKYFFGAIYEGCVNPGQLKRQVALIKEEMELLFAQEVPHNNEIKNNEREGFLFKDISDEEIDRLFRVSGI